MQAAVWPLTGQTASQLVNSWPVATIHSFVSRLKSIPSISTRQLSNDASPSHRRSSLPIPSPFATISPRHIYNNVNHIAAYASTSTTSLSAQSIIFPFLPKSPVQARKTFLTPYLRASGITFAANRPSFSIPRNAHTYAYKSIPSSRRAFSLLNRSAGPTPSVASLATIKVLESEVAQNPKDLKAHLALLNALSETKHTYGAETIISRWERMSEFDPSSPLLHSDAAFELYLKALHFTNQTASVPHAVKRRETLMASHPLIVDPPSTEVPSPAAPASRSQQIADKIMLSSLAIKPSLKSGFNRLLMGDAAMRTDIADGRQEPIRVVLEESRGNIIWRLARFVILTIVLGFVGLTVLSLMLENSGLMKAGPTQKEWEASTSKTVKFSDVHGVDEAKEDLEEIVEFLKDPTKFSSLGGRLPKGVLLTGPPGTGKTMLAKAVAGEAGVPFLFASGSEFDEIFVGTGAKRVRELFAAARKKQPAIIFIDELDAIGSKRSAKDQHYMKQTLNQLLVELDGFKESEGVIVIAATNFPQSLDQALVRPGRFDKKVIVPLPDVKGRAQILIHHMRDILSDITVDPTIIARGTTGFSGADLQNLVNQAAIQASRERAKHVTLKHFEWAKDKILMGAERKSAVITEKEKRMTAYHESGHALVALYTEGATPLHKVTCMPRGHALGVTQFLPSEDRVSRTFKEYCAELDVAMGGRVAEEIIYGKENITSGASSDIQNATNTATGMVRYWGYSDKLGPVHFGDHTSPQMNGQIDNEIRRMLEESMARTRKLLTERKADLHKLTNALVEYETLDRSEVEALLKGQKIRQDDRELEKIREELGLPEPSPEDVAAITKLP
ncbi:hypothetical protein FRB95_002397 [Tulasnella sp. JGI-2019a]|nr:hypothetical protein FRB95_002397 [Tulasnella sp. JGI-2019a]